jgi:hypothetical protein
MNAESNSLIVDYQCVNYPQDSSVITWVATRLHPDRYQLLQDIGFCWKVDRSAMIIEINRSSSSPKNPTANDRSERRLDPPWRSFKSRKRADDVDSTWHPHLDTHPGQRRPEACTPSETVTGISGVDPDQASKETKRCRLMIISIGLNMRRLLSGVKWQISPCMRMPF